MAITLDGTNGINSSGVIVAPDGSASAPAITNDGDTNTGIFFPAADTIAFAEGGAEAMRIDSSGNVGIGTTSPTNVGLHINKASAVGSGIRVQNTAATWDLVNTSNGDFEIYTGGAKVFLVGTNNAERMRIDSSGNINIATTNDSAARLVINGADNHVINTIRNGTGVSTHIAFRNGNGQVGTISTSNSTTSYNTSSDYRLKENIAPMTGALATVAQLKPCTYTWRVDGSAGQGFIAHELQAVVPDCVIGEKDAVETYTDEEGVEQTRPVYQGVDTSFLVATLTAAIQELSAKNDALEARIAALEGAQA
jgi:hypothetical protein